MPSLTLLRDHHVEAEKLRFGIRQARASSLGGFIVAPVLAIYLSRDLPPVVPIAWMMLILAVLALRNHWLSIAERSLVDQPVEFASRLFHYSSLALALVIALLPAWALPRLPLDHGLLFTTVLCIWLSGGMLSLGVLPRLFAAYAILVAAGLTAGWFLSGSDFAPTLIALTLLYALVLLSFSRNFARVVEEGIRIRLTNQELVQELSLANQAKNRFILAASHDLKQPLQALVLFSHALSHSQDGQEMRRVASGVQQSVKALEQLFSAVLDLSKIDAKAITPLLQPVFLPELLNRLSREYDYLCREKGLAWRMQHLPLTLKTDPALLERLLRNLLDNAVKHGARGPIEIGMTLGASLMLTVSDHGPGIAPTEREHVFKEFYRLGATPSVGGLGLGLAIVQRLVGLLGYRLTISYTDPQQRLGAQFRLEIPRTCVIEEPAPADSFRSLRDDAAPATDLTGLSVLVIDDDPGVLHATLLLLRQWGCHALSAPNMQALPSDPSFAPDVALIDNSQLTQGNALTMAEAVLARWPQAGVILLTGESDPTALATLRDGGYPLLEKPVAPEKLRQVLELFRHLD